MKRRILLDAFGGMLSDSQRGFVDFHIDQCSEGTQADPCAVLRVTTHCATGLMLAALQSVWRVSLFRRRAQARIVLRECALRMFWRSQRGAQALATVQVSCRDNISAHRKRTREWAAQALLQHPRNREHPEHRRPTSAHTLLAAGLLGEHRHARATAARGLGVLALDLEAPEVSQTTARARRTLSETQCRRRTRSPRPRQRATCCRGVAPQRAGGGHGTACDRPHNRGSGVQIAITGCTHTAQARWHSTSERHHRWAVAAAHRCTRAFFMRSKSSRHLLSIVDAVTCE